ncbi:MAG: DinB family protein [Cellvibrionaceae bacterium]
MSTSSLLASLYQYKAWANEELFTAVKALDQEESQADLHSATRILNHIYVVDRIFAANLQGLSPEYTDTNTTETPTLEGLCQSVREMDGWYIDYVASLADQQLPEKLTFRFVDGDTGTMSREEILIHVISHGTYHRGAVGRIMAEQSIAAPRDIFTRFLHESEPGRRNGA